MIERLSGVPDGATLEAEICVIGAGAAGLTLARTLAASGRRVLVLEGGGLAFSSESQALYEGSSEGPIDYSLASTRMRFLGGSTNCWTGFCMPLEPEDFARRDWIPASGWPIDPDELAPYYRDAQVVLGLGDWVYTASDRLSTHEPFLEIEPSKLRYRIWQLSAPARFNIEYRDELEASDRIRLLLEANATSLQLDDGHRRVVAVTVRGFDGRTVAVKARRWVLALGGIENARLLLASRDALANGVGNAHDNVGRYFMEHPLLPTARFFPTRYTGWLHANQNIGVPGDGRAAAGLAPSATRLREQRTLDAVMTISEGRRNYDAGYMTLARLRRSWDKREWPEDLSGEIWKVASDLDDVWAGLCANVTGEHYDAISSEDGALTVNTHLEQAPVPESRVVLTDERDELGMPRVHLDWRLGELERRTILEANRTVGEELGRLGLGRLQIDEWVLDEPAEWPTVGVKCHHMGTTRMARSAADGVVDADSRVHGIDNLWIAGSSVFPTSGVANPTLTIVALSLRLADRLGRDV